MTDGFMRPIGMLFVDRPERARRYAGGAPARADGTNSLSSAWSPLRRVGNVVPFIRPDEVARAASSVAVDPETRPAPPRPIRFERTWLLSLLAASAVFHAAAFIAFERQPPPLASTGVRSISVELVLGTDAAAGLAETPTKSEAAVDAVAVRGEALELVKPETARAEIKVSEQARDIETQTAAAPPTWAAIVAAPVDVAKPEIAPQAVMPEPPKPAATLPTSAVAVPKPRPPTPRDVRRQHNDHGRDARKRKSRSSAASVASSGIGRGRSDADTNYRGIVAAQLARNKYFPPDARRNGDQGNAVVSFRIDGGGQVTEVTLARGTGIASLDREAQAMVRRASPFPQPPAGRPMRFTVPVSFNLR